MTTWNEATPAGTEYISGGDDIIRDFKAAVRERLEREHYMLGSGDSADDGKHRLASGIAANRPDAVTGHVYVSTDTSVVSFAIASGVWIDLRPDDLPGVVKLFAGSSAPSGWLVCNGNAISRTSYASLFAVIGTTYGVGDGSTTFNLPDLKGRVPIGLDSSQTEFDALGDTGGAKTHTLATAEMPAHGHTVTDPGHTHDPLTGTNFLVFVPSGGTNTLDGGPYVKGEATTKSAVTGITIANAGGGGAHNNLQPYVTLNYIIKY